MMLRSVFLTLLMLMPLASLATDEIKCNSSGNQLELNACASDGLVKADKELNLTYLSLLKKESDDQIFISKLRLAQKAWLAFRDAELEAIFACSDVNVRICWGSMYPMSYAYRKAELTRERTKQLQKILKDGRGE
ncbi:MAG: lysozyme inhibitor LprI family protein [Burkholderiaceae bacterium]